jgi:creatinine amidohydrolase/Fe(II)-dependent formamide hydrolase-like protein
MNLRLPGGTPNCQKDAFLHVAHGRRWLAGSCCSVALRAKKSARRGLLLTALVAASAAAHAGASVQLEELTSTELRDRIAAGATTLLIPVGGTEQNGAHLVLGKHNVRVRVLAGRIAARLGDAMVAPVLAYVPEGRIDPPTQHMRWAGTISIPEPVFEATLVAAVQSLRRHGLCEVYFLGDHGGYRASLDRAAATLNRTTKPVAGARAPCRAHALPEYYRAASADFDARLRSEGHATSEIGTHAGLADTALALAADPTLVRPKALALALAPAAGSGVAGDPRRATAAMGQPGLDHIVDVTVAAVLADRQRR